MFKLSKPQIDRFYEEGYFSIDNIFSENEVKEMGNAVDRLAGTINSLDKEAVIKLAQETGAIVTVEEHQIIGGVGGAVAEVLAKHHPAPLEMIGMQDRYGESGEAEELLEYFQLTAPYIEKAVKKIMRRK